MEEKNFIEQPISPEENISAGETVSTAPVAVSQEKQIADLKGLTRTLLGAVQVMQAQSAHNAVFEEAVADVRAATRAMLTAPVVGATAVTKPTPSERDCCGGDDPCGCVSKDCCRFEIVLAKVRGAQPQIEPPDAGDIPVTINAMEVQIYITAGDPAAGFVLPGLASTLDLRTNGLPGGPGPWVTVERVVNTIDVRKGTTVTTDVFVEVREHDEGLERPVAFKDEIGEGSGSITLDCCMSKIYPPTPIDIYLSHGGEGKGMVQAAFYARRVCC